LYFKEDVNLSTLPFKRKIKIFAKKNRTLSKILISNTEIKHVNNKAKISLYLVNRERNITKFRYFLLNKTLLNNFLKEYYVELYEKNIIRIYDILKKSNFDYIFVNSTIQKRKFIKYKLQFLRNIIYLKHLCLKNIMNHIIYKYCQQYLTLLRKYELHHLLNEFKLNQSIFLPKLSYLLNRILNKKIEYNIINLKTFSGNSDIFINIVEKLIRRKKRISLLKDMSYALARTYLPDINTITERTPVSNNFEKLFIKYNDSKLISNITKKSTLTSIMNNYHEYNNNKNKIHKALFDSIHYKNMAGIRIEVKGRLTKRYRADRALYKFASKGGLRNIYSSYQGLSSVLFRGNTKSNLSYS
jgi:hypothetical protein